MADSQARARADRIREKIPIVQLLEDFGYGVRASGGDREQQFSCNLHGDGQDNKPSARVYPDSDSWYCVHVADRVLTSRGWVPLGSTQQNNPPTLDGEGIFSKPLAYLDRGVRECVTVRTRSGYQVTLTPDHEVAVQGGDWCKAGDLRPGVELVVPLPQEPIFPPSCVPWSIEKGEVLGSIPWEQSEGHRVPPLVWKAPREGVLGFLRGTYTQYGSVTQGPEGARVNLCYSSEGFLQDIQLLLLQCGVMSCVSGMGCLQLVTDRDILVFRSLVGFADEGKQKDLGHLSLDPEDKRHHKVLVESVTPAGALPVADLTMPSSPTFVAGGIKVHNCFACDMTRDSIATVMAVEGLDFWPAVKWIEHKYKLPPMKWDAPKEKSAVDSVRSGLRHDRTFDDDIERAYARLDRITQDRSLPMMRTLVFWEAVDKVYWHVKGPKGSGGPWPEGKGRIVLSKLQDRILEALVQVAT